LKCVDRPFTYEFTPSQVLLKLYIHPASIPLHIRDIVYTISTSLHPPFFPISTHQYLAIIIHKHKHNLPPTTTSHQAQCLPTPIIRTQSPGAMLQASGAELLGAAALTMMTALGFRRGWMALPGLEKDRGGVWIRHWRRGVRRASGEAQGRRIGDVDGRGREVALEAMR
ncbi:hypothetical protein BU26DRAFT_591754, partial [Trematosphaeria pertusa]